MLIYRLLVLALGFFAAREIVRKMEEEEQARMRDKAAESGDDVLEPLLKDETIHEIMVNGPGSIFIDQHGKLMLYPKTFPDASSYRRAIDKLLAKADAEVNEANPMCDVRLPDGTRVNVVIPPMATNGAVLTIAKANRPSVTIEKMVGYQVLGQSMAQFLKACIQCRVNIIISGGYAAGRTSVLKVLADYIPAGDRIVTIDAAPGLVDNHENVVRLGAP